MQTSPLTLDQAGLQSLEVLAAVTEQVLGPRTMAVRELQKVIDERSFGAYWRASTAFNALSGVTRSKIADRATTIARRFHDPSADMRSQFPELFKGVPASTARVWH